MRELKQNTYFCVGFSATIIFDISLAAKRLSGNSERFFIYIGSSPVLTNILKQKD